MFEKITERVIDFFFDKIEVDEATSRDPEQTAVKRVGYAIVPSSSGGSSRKNFESPDFDLETIETAYLTESYIYQAICKYLDLVFKAGWTLKGKNQNSLDYIKMRLAVMEEATDTTTDQLLMEIADSVIKYANAFIIKARMKQGVNIPGLNIQGFADRQPVGGYFSLPPSSITIARDANGMVLMYQQKVAGQRKELNIKPEDMIHITWKKPIGKAFGIPFLLPVLDDIRLLREIEDNVSNLLYKYLHPLYKFIVGLQEDGKESTPEEIEYVRQMIAEMPMDGTIVIPERYDVEVVGAEGAAIDASWALKYFEQRVFSGLGVPETVFGRASTANKSTADNLTVEMHDRVKAFQKVIAKEIDFRIIRELLMEGGFDPLLRPEDDVEFMFNEIAVDEKHKVENQLIQEFTQNAITFEEMRTEMGRDPEVDESRLFMNMITIPTAVATAAAKITDSTNSGTPSSNNKARPTNQYGTKPNQKKTASAAPPRIKESFSDLKTEEYFEKILGTFRSLKQDVIGAFKNGVEDQTELYMSLVKKKLMEEADKNIRNSFALGISSCKKDCNVGRNPDIPKSVLTNLVSRSEENIDRILNKLREFIETAQSKETMDQKVIFLTSAFDATEYRLRLMAQWHSRFAYNYSYALAAVSFEREELSVIGAGCEICQEKNETTIKLDKNRNLMETVPPWHFGCDCYVKVKR